MNRTLPHAPSHVPSKLQPSSPQLSVSTAVLATLLFLFPVLLSATPSSASLTPEEAKTPPPEATRHDSGLVTQVLRDGEGDQRPSGEDIVVLHFTGWDREGKPFTSTRNTQQPQPRSIPMSMLFPGWRLALEDMVPGEMRRVWVPEELGPDNKQGPKSAVFDLELLEIRQLPEMPPLTAPDEAQRSPSGARWQQVKPASSEESPPKGGTALLAWTQWGPKGNVVQSTTVRGRPTAFMLDRVFLGFAEIVEEMKVGEARYVWIPAAVHGGQWPGAKPNEPLILHVELVRVLPNDALPRQG